MSEWGTAVLSAVVAVLVVLLTQRSSSRIAAADRLAERRATLYVDVARWLEDDLRALRDREPYRSAPLSPGTVAELRTLGSDPINRGLAAHARARHRARKDLESLRRVTAVAVHVGYVQQQMRAELGAPLTLLDRVAFAVLGSPVFASLLAATFALLFQKRYRAEAPVLVLPPVAPDR